MVMIELEDLDEIERDLVEENAFLFESPQSYVAGVQALVRELRRRSGASR